MFREVIDNAEEVRAEDIPGWLIGAVARLMEEYLEELTEAA